jgi:hypothetical protein
MENSFMKKKVIISITIIIAALIIIEITRINFIDNILLCNYKPSEKYTVYYNDKRFDVDKNKIIEKIYDKIRYKWITKCSHKEAANSLEKS